MKLALYISSLIRLRAAMVLLTAILLAGACLPAQTSKENSEFKLAVNLFNDAMYDLASEQLKNFIAAYPGTAQGIEARFYLGQTQMKLKRFDEARVTFQNFALSYVEHPKASEAWMNVGEAFQAMGNGREAASAYERVKVFHPKSAVAPDALLKAAQLYRTTGDRESARKALRAILQEYPSSKSVLPARLAIGELYAEEGQTELALREARRVSESDAPTSVRAAALYAIGRMQTSASLLDDAETTFRSVASVYPGTPVAPLSLLELGMLESRAGKHTQAAEHLRAVAGNDKLDDSLRSRANMELGRALASRRDFSGALQAFEQSVALSRTTELNVVALLLASDAAAEDGQWEKALLTAREAAARPPSASTRRALVLVARAASALRLYDEAAQAYRSFLAQFPADPYADEILFRLGALNQEQRSDFRNAITVYDQLIQEHPQSRLCADAAFATAAAQQSLGDADGALKTYLDIQKRYPASGRASTLDSLIDAMRRRSVSRRDEALRKLTRLIGEVLLEKSKPELAFQLGLIYLNDLGDYAAAAEQFGAALSAGVAGERRADAAFYQARAMQLLSESDPGERAKAAQSYDDFLKEFSTSVHAEEAFFERTRLSGSADTGTAAALREFLSRYPKSPRAGLILVELGKNLLARSRAAEALPMFLGAAAQPSSPANNLEALWCAAEAYRAGGAADSAAALWQRIIGSPFIDRHTVGALMASGRLLLEKNRAERALENFSRVQKAFPYTPEAAEAERLAGDARLGMGDPGQAAAVYRALADRRALSPFNPGDDVGLLLALVEAIERKGDRQEAVALYHRIIAISTDPGVKSKAFYALGSLARAGGSNEGATAYFRQAAALGGAASATPEIADLLFQTEQYAEAAKQYLQLAQAAGSDEAALARRREYRVKAVIATFRLDKVAEAQAMADEFTKSFGKQKSVLGEFAYEKGLSYYRKQDYASARKAFNSVVDDYAETRGPWGKYYIGKIFEVTGALDQAAKEYTKILEEYPSSDVGPRVHLSLGNMHFNAERFEDAIRHYQTITAQPEKAGDILPYAMNNLIEAYESTKLYDNALRTARDFIERYPNDESIIDKKIKIGTLYTKTGYYDQAILHFQGILDEAGSLLEAEIRYDIGEAYYYKADYQQAILEFLKVPYLVSKQGKVDWTATSFYMAGQSYEKMSRFDEAIGMYQQIIDRPGIDATFKAAARKEIDRVKMLTKKGSK